MSGRHNVIASSDQPGPWVRDAACAGEPDRLFFPERGESNLPAKTICRTCPVELACLRFALDTNQAFGIWGGTSPKERRRIRRAGRSAA